MKIQAWAVVALCFAASVCRADDLVCGECLGGHSNFVPFDLQAPWAHGQHKRLPAYAGYGSFRPYNYRHVAPQSQIAIRWGATPGLPYSAGHANRYQVQSTSQRSASPQPVGYPVQQNRMPATLASSPQRPVPLLAQQTPGLKPVPPPANEAGSPSVTPPTNRPPTHVYPSHLQ